MTVESDVKAGDLLVSSGLDGIFPAGYPVATVTKVERNTADTFATVEAGRWRNSIATVKCCCCGPISRPPARHPRRKPSPSRNRQPRAGRHDDLAASARRHDSGGYDSDDSNPTTATPRPAAPAPTPPPQQPQE